MPDRREDADNVQNKDRRNLHFALDDLESFAGVVRDRLGVQAGNQSEAEVEYVEKDKAEEKDARDALHEVEPVARVLVSEIVRAHLEGDEQPVNSMKDERQEDAEDFQQQNIRNALQILNRVVESLCAHDGFRVCVKMFEEKRAERQDAGELKEFAEHETPV